MVLEITNCYYGMKKLSLYRSHQEYISIVHLPTLRAYIARVYNVQIFIILDKDFFFDSSTGS